MTLAGCFVLLSSLPLAACGRLTDGNRILTSQEVAGFANEIRLSHSLNAVALGEVVADTLRPTLDLTKVEDTPLGRVVDVASGVDGEFAVLEWHTRSLLRFDRSGNLLQRVGRKGEGPGELTHPVSFAWVGTEMIVLELKPTAVLTAFSVSGNNPRVNTESLLQSGAQRQWGPTLMHQVPMSSGLEDAARRTMRESDTSVVVAVRKHAGVEESVQAERSSDTWMLVRVTPSLEKVDTLATLAGSSLLPDPMSPGSFAQEIFGSQPLWAAGKDWIALGHGNSSFVRVVDPTGAEILRISWPQDRRSVREEDRLKAAEWSGEYTMRLSPGARSAAAKLTPFAIAEQYRLHASRFAFADSSAAITAIHGAGHCLWLAGWNSSDFIDGTASTWAVINVRSRKVLGVFRLSELKDVRLRDVSPRFALATYEDDSGQTHVLGFDIPVEGCDAH